MYHQIVTTKDQSHTLFLPHLNEHYHSIHGAVQESQHVFIKNGLEYFRNLSPTKNINVFEIGFGTGLNALLTLLKGLEYPHFTIAYSTIEAYPLPQEIIQQLNYTSQLNIENDNSKGFPSPLGEGLGVRAFKHIHSAEWNKPTEITSNFSIHKIHQTLQQIQLSETYDIIFFDAFAPEKQPEMWTKEIFQKLFLHLNAGGILVTYCAKGIIKRTLKEIGFTIETLQGPPGKREMIRAIKIS